MLCMALLFGAQLYTGNWLQTDLQALLPQQAGRSPILLAAENKQENSMNRQVIALIGHHEAAQAFKLAAAIAEQWRQSTLFQQVDARQQPDPALLRDEIKRLRLAVLPVDIRRQLLNEPSAYFQQYAEQILNPFMATHLLPTEQDWLGFGRFVLPQSRLHGRVMWHAGNGMLYIPSADKTWVLLRAELADGNLINPQQSLPALMRGGEQVVQQQDGEWLVAGSALFAAAAKQQAEKESRSMALIGIGLTLLLLLAVFRTLRVLWLFLPIAAGMLAGVSLTILVFGQIHILTLVIGTSLIGVLIDFPLHWLSGALFNSDWQAEKAMRKLRLTFLVSLLVTLLGYALLGFTRLPVLRQTALFSAVALLSAVLCTWFYLPARFNMVRMRKVRSFFGENFSFRLSSVGRKWIVSGIAVWLAVGIYHSEWQDDVRQWVALPPQLLAQVQKIGSITGIEPGSRYFLLIAENDDSLLEADNTLREQLLDLQTHNKLQDFQSLSRWIMSAREQQDFIRQLTRNIQAQDYAVLSQIGMPAERIAQELQALSTQPQVLLGEALDMQIAQGYRPLYLGELAAGKVAALVNVSGITDLQAVSALADNRTVYWLDKPAQLNRTFQQTRDQAAWLKGLSFLLAGLLLWRFFGLRRTLRMLFVPLLAIVATIGILGWLKVPVTLFSMFGLLLVSAIGIDYTAYMQTVQAPLYAKRAALSLAAATTLISFVLLALSSTPAVAYFGLSVSIGVLLSILIIFMLYNKPGM